MKIKYLSLLVPFLLIGCNKNVGPENESYYKYQNDRQEFIHNEDNQIDQYQYLDKAEKKMIAENYLTIAEQEMIAYNKGLKEVKQEVLLPNQNKFDINSEFDKKYMPYNNNSKKSIDKLNEKTIKGKLFFSSFEDIEEKTLKYNFKIMFSKYIKSNYKNSFKNNLEFKIKKNISILELAKKISNKISIPFEIMNEQETIVFKENFYKKFYIPKYLTEDGKINDILSNIKILTNNENTKNIVFDSISSHLYVKDKFSKIEKIDNYLKTLKSLSNIDHELELVMINFLPDKGESLNWEAVKRQLYISDKNQNIKINKLKNNYATSIFQIDANYLGTDYILERLLSYLNYKGTAKINERYLLKTKNNNLIPITSQVNIPYVDKENKIYTKNNGYNINILPSYDYINDKIDIKLNFKEESVLGEKKVDIDMPITSEKSTIINSSVTNGSYLLIGGLKTKENLSNHNFLLNYYNENGQTIILLKIKTNLKKLDVNEFK